MGEAKMRSTPKDVDREMGLLVKQLREERGWKDYQKWHDQILAATGVSISAAVLRLMEMGYYNAEGEPKTRGYSAGEIRAIAITLGVTSDYLIGIEWGEEDA